MALDDTVQIQITNAAFARIGISKTITAIAEQSREALTANTLWEQECCAVLRAFPWAFATKYKDLTLWAGTAAVAINGDWQYAFEHPSDCLFARRVVMASGRKFSHAVLDPLPFRIGRELAAVTGEAADSLVIYTNCDPTELEYTAKFVCPAVIPDCLWEDTMTWRLAAAIAPALSRLPNMATTAWKMYLHSIETATAVNAKEQQPELPGEAEWINARQ